MKTVLFILGLIFSLPFVACSNDDDHYKPEEPVTRAFEQKYPGITPKEWERKGNYVVAEFYENGVEKEAWFDNTGNWYMTESDIRFSALPEAIKTAFAAGEYAQWHVDDVDMLERAGMETVYVIEVEQGKQGGGFVLYGERHSGKNRCGRRREPCTFCRFASGCNGLFKYTLCRCPDC